MRIDLTGLSRTSRPSSIRRRGIKSLPPTQTRTSFPTIAPLGMMFQKPIWPPFWNRIASPMCVACREE